MLRSVSIRTLLLGINVFILLVPVLAVVLLRIYDTHLIQQTERRLIAEVEARTLHQGDEITDLLIQLHDGLFELERTQRVFVFGHTNMVLSQKDDARAVCMYNNG